MSCTAKDSAAQEDGLAEGGWPAVVGVRVEGDLVEAQKIKSEEDGEEGRFACVEVLHAKAVGMKFSLEFLDSRFDQGALVVIAPEKEGGLAAVGDKDTEGIAGDMEEFASDGSLALPNAFADDKETPFSLPTGELSHELANGIVLVDESPS